MIEPIFGDIKFNRKFDQFHRRGRSAALGVAADHRPPTT
jgi:hypothetical protein